VITPYRTTTADVEEPDNAHTKELIAKNTQSGNFENWFF
jgi:hypothetical protein